MCGRTACTLNKQGLQRATCQYSRNNQNLPWIQKYDWQSYQPGYNISPSQVCPVIVNTTAFPGEAKDKGEDYALTLMKWGLIPSWYKGTLQDSTFKNNNCRHESILSKPTFRGAASSGRRCIILADGFYEWKEVQGSKRKQPYFIYFPQENGNDVFFEDYESMAIETEWRGPKLLTMAGIFDVWKSREEEILYSFSIITLDASKTVSFVHHRMPAILNGKDEISMWLDTNRVPTKEAITILKPVEELEMHPVSSLVSNFRNNTKECMMPYKEPDKTTFKHTALTSWLMKGSPTKRSKTE